ncbi:MAG: ABC transporter permease [Planctomycetes bacterium]|jgi:simple sugar transport system permease protein|nr:ABC transporter permease [Planctomycetota bacterium]
MRALLHRHEFYLAALTLALSAGIALANPAFCSVANLFDLCQGSTVMGLFALGVLIVLVSGGIDVSFAAIGAFSMYVTSKVLLGLDFQGSAAVALVLGGAIGTLLGLFNAFFIGFLRLPTLIVTLGSASLFRGFLLAFIGTAIVNTLPAGMVRFSKLTLWEMRLADGTIAGLPASFLLLVVAALLVGCVLQGTMLGRGIYALGGNPVAAARAGFNLRGRQLFIYGGTGLLSGLAGVVHACMMRNANPFDLVGMELNVLAAVVLGGAGITGGRGTVLGTLLGVGLIVTINNSLILLDVPSYWQKVVVGAVILVSTGITARTGWARARGAGLC